MDYHITHGWGDRLEWWNVDSLRVSGHQSRIPEVGDYLLSPMESGKMGRFEFVTVEPCGDPPDMFFGTVRFVGYDDAPVIQPIPGPIARATFGR